MVRPNVPGRPKAVPTTPAAATAEEEEPLPPIKVNPIKRSKEALVEAKEALAPEQAVDENPAALVFEATGLGNLPDLIQSNAEMDKRRRETWNTYDDAVRELEAIGLPVEQPEPDVPCPYRLSSEDILTDDSRAFTTQYAECLAWEGYLKTIHARLCAQQLQAEHEEKVLKAEIKDILVKKYGKKSQKDLDDRVTTSLDYQAAAARLQKCTQQLLMVKAMVDQQSANLKVLSRQVTINGQELEAEMIKNNMGNRGRPPTATTASPNLPLLGASKFARR